MRKIFYTILVSLFLPEIVFGAPNISGVSGTLTHESAVTISGNDFGTKNPAFPVIWDNGSGRSDQADPSAGDWYGWRPYSLTGSDAQYNCKYHSVGFRGVTGPHPFTQNYLAGAAALGWAGAGPEGQGVFVGKKFNATGKFYGSMRWRFDPNFYYGDDNNFKHLMYTPVANDGSFNDINYVLFTWAQPIVSQWFTYAPVQCGDNSYCGENGEAEDARVNWVKTDLVVEEGNNGTARLFDDGTLRADGAGNISGGDWANGERYMMFGGFMRPDLDENPPYPNNYRYMTDLYLDNTWSRVELCVNSTWSDHGLCEIQPPISWNNLSATVTLNQGSFDVGETAYVYVVDSTGAVNENGYPVTIGGEGGDTTLPGNPGRLSVR